MKLSIQLTICTLVLLLGSVFAPQVDAQSGVVNELIDFESFATGPQPGNFLSAFGITILVTPAGQPSVQPEGTTPPFIINPGGGNFFAAFGTPLDNTVILLFDPPVFRFRFDRISTQGGARQRLPGMRWRLICRASQWIASATGLGNTRRRRSR